MELIAEDEVFKTISEGGGNYKLSNYGRVLSRERWVIAKNGMKHHTKSRILKNIGPSKSNQYLRIDIAGKKVCLHRLVCKYFVINNDPEKYNVTNHRDGKKINNYYKNLEWTDHRGNAIHAVKTGLINCLSSDDKDFIVLFCREHGRNAESHEFLSKKFDRTKTTIRNISRGAY